MNHRSHFQVRKAQPEEAKQIAFFLKKNFNVHNLKFNAEYVSGSFKNGIWIIAKSNSEIVGTVLLRLILPDARGEIKHLIVKEKYGRQGIGKALLSYAIKTAKNKKLRKITGMAVSTQLMPLRKLASAFKFKREGILKEHFRKDEDVYVYSLFI